MPRKFIGGPSKTQRNRVLTDAKSIIIWLLPDMPVVLVGLISDYSARLPHTFTVGFDMHTGASTWYTLVSDRSFDDGDLDWSVEYKTNGCGRGPSFEGAGFVGVGITTSTISNERPRHRLTESDMSDQNDCILSCYSNWTGPTKDLMLRHSGQPIEKIVTDFAITTIWFSADILRKTVRARWLADSAGKIGKSVVWPVTDFERLRPCVILSGNAEVVIQSGASIDPSAFRQQLTVCTSVS